MKRCLLIVAVLCWIRQNEGATLTSPRGLSQHDRELFREILCVLKGKTAHECLEDDSVEALIHRLAGADDLNEENSLPGKPPKFLSASEALPPGVAAKREAFYSDWRRRR